MGIAIAVGSGLVGGAVLAMIFRSMILKDVKALRGSIVGLYSHAVKTEMSVRADMHRELSALEAKIEAVKKAA